MAAVISCCHVRRLSSESALRWILPLTAAFSSWPLDGRVIALLLLTALIYLRGWLKGRRSLRDQNDSLRLLSFLASLLILFLATESPLDAFDSLFLSAHMAQHLLLMMIAPPLLLLSHPFLPMLRGLPKGSSKKDWRRFFPGRR